MSGRTGRHSFRGRGRRVFHALFAIVVGPLFLCSLPGVFADTGANHAPVFAGEHATRTSGVARPTPHVPRPSAGNGSPLPGNWTELVNSTLTPPTRQSGEMVYDPVLDEYLLFGGSSSLAAPLNDTWAFAHGNWTDLSARVPSSLFPRWYSMMVWDAADQYVLLFGGRNFTQDFNDTWIYNGTGWHALFPATAPPPITSGKFAYDAGTSEVVLYGGFSVTAPYKYNFTWTFRGGNWTNITGNVTGAPPDPHAVTYATYDSADGYELLVGGSGTSGGNCDAPAYTWTYQNGTYTNLSANLTLEPPLGQGSRMMAYDPAFSGVVVFGGWDNIGCPFSNQTWLFRGGSWYNLTTAYNPGPVWDGVMASDPSDDSILLFSGEIPFGQSDETWNFTPALLVGASVAPVRGTAPLLTDLTGSATGLAPLSYEWTFGDGTPGVTTLNATHTFASAGKYYPVLRVGDALGRFRDASTFVQVFTVLTTNASATPSTGDAPWVVSFAARSFGGDPPVSFFWTFGDGLSQLGANPDHTYVGAGTYNWTVTGTDSLGNAANSSGTVTVHPPPAFASFDLTPTLGVAPFTVDGNVTASNGTVPYNYTWNFGDGTASVTGAAARHTYTEAGTFPGQVSISDGAGRSVVRHFNVTSVAPMAVGVLATPRVGEAPLDVEFAPIVSGGQGPYSFSWSFGEVGASSSAPEPSHVFTVPGVYPVAVNVTDTSGQRVEGNTTVEVVRNLTATLTPEWQAAVAPAAENFVVVPMGGLTPYSVAWTFGDGSSSAGGTAASHTYAHPGTFTVHATVSDAANDTLVVGGTVVVVAPLSVRLTTNSSVAFLGAPVGLVASITGGENPFNLSWTGLAPGCPLEPTAASVSCTPTRTGTFSIEVTVHDALDEQESANTTLEVIPFTEASSPPPPLLTNGEAAVLLGLAIAGGAGAGVLIWRRRRATREVPDESVIIEPPKGAPTPPPEDDAAPKERAPGEG